MHTSSLCIPQLYEKSNVLLTATVYTDPQAIHISSLSTCVPLGTLVSIIVVVVVVVPLDL